MEDVLLLMWPDGGWAFPTNSGRAVNIERNVCRLGLVAKQQPDIKGRRRLY